MPTLTKPAHSKNTLGGPVFQTNARQVDEQERCCDSFEKGFCFSYRSRLESFAVGTFGELVALTGCSWRCSHFSLLRTRIGSITVIE